MEAISLLTQYSNLNKELIEDLVKSFNLFTENKFKIKKIFIDILGIVCYNSIIEERGTPHNLRPLKGTCLK